MKTTRPKARPTSAPKSSKRPMSRGDAAKQRAMDNAAKREAYDQKTLAKKKAGGKMTKKYAKGGMARGCGAATKGKRYSRAG